SSSTSTAAACYVTYTLASNRLSLAGDDPVVTTSLTPGAGIAQNSQCFLDGTASSISMAGGTLSLTLSLVVRAGFGGIKNVYGSASDAAGSSGLVQLGTWNVVIPPPQPTADSVTPNAASGASQTFTFQFSDAQSSSNLTG